MQHLIKNTNCSTKMMVIRNYIIICFNAENIYKLHDAAASEIKPQEEYFSISHTHEKI